MYRYNNNNNNKNNINFSNMNTMATSLHADNGQNSVLTFLDLWHTYSCQQTTFKYVLESKMDWVNSSIHCSLAFS